MAQATAFKEIRSLSSIDADDYIFNEASHDRFNRVLRGIAVLMLKAFAILIPFAMILASPATIPVVLLAAAGWNEYWKMQKQAK